MRYYKLLWDQDIRDGWFLGVKSKNDDGSQRDIWAYTRCERIERIVPVEASIQSPGTPRDFDIWGGANMPIVSPAFAECVARIAGDEVQRIPVAIETLTLEVLNVLTEIDCLNYDESVIQFWPKDPKQCHRPEKAGMPRGVIRLWIDSPKADPHHIFRLKNWKPPIIVSEAIKDELEKHSFVGAKFRRVSD